MHTLSPSLHCHSLSHCFFLSRPSWPSSTRSLSSHPQRERERARDKQCVSLRGAYRLLSASQTKKMTKMKVVTRTHNVNYRSPSLGLHVCKEKGSSLRSDMVAAIGAGLFLMGIVLAGGIAICYIQHLRSSSALYRYRGSLL